MRSTATWRSMGLPGSERKSGWYRATSARRSIYTTKSGTAAGAGWKEAGESRHAGWCAKDEEALQPIFLDSHVFRLYFIIESTLHYWMRAGNEAVAKTHRARRRDRPGLGSRVGADRRRDWHADRRSG